MKKLFLVLLLGSLIISNTNVFAQGNDTPYLYIPSDIQTILEEQEKFNTYSEQVTLTGTMKTNADNLAKACVENYKEYGVLPSVCIGQAFIESHIGVDHSQTDYNWWGIASCNIGYSTFDEGVIGYLSTINNGYYSNAPFNTDPYSTISAIAPNYATSSTYQQDVTWAINNYNLTAYDDYLFDSKEYNEYLESVEN
ncbi:MAG: glucosaminidase domain-containing protein [Bacilli bacterium]|nr:glucosaminidase domain-containing protein [Bacilli bacterium]